MDAVSPAAAAAWLRAGRYYWTHGNWTICAVTLSGRRRFELWHHAQFIAADENPQPLRELAQQTGSSTAVEAG